LGATSSTSKKSVTMQQTYARVSGARERLSIASLWMTRLQMNTATFARRGIQVVRRYADVPPVTVDKNKVLQNPRQPCQITLNRPWTRRDAPIGNSPSRSS